MFNKFDSCIVLQAGGTLVYQVRAETLMTMTTLITMITMIIMITMITMIARAPRMTRSFACSLFTVHCPRVPSKRCCLISLPWAIPPPRPSTLQVTTLSHSFFCYYCYYYYYYIIIICLGGWRGRAYSPIAYMAEIVKCLSRDCRPCAQRCPAQRL